MTSSDEENNLTGHSRPEELTCPVPAAHDRLHDSHRLWHQVVGAYFDIDGFRANVNACIEALRSVTWVVQKQKEKIPDFGPWYVRWQERLKADPILRWLVQARNRIVKEGDLAPRSTVQVAVVASYAAPPVFEFTVNPLRPTESIARSIDFSLIPEEVKKDGFLRVERRWVANDLPDGELLDALSYWTVPSSPLDRPAPRQVSSS